MSNSQETPAPAGRPSANPKVAVVVLAWNGKSLTLACLESLEALRYENATVILVDNASTDGTAAEVRKAFGARVAVVENRENLGFSRGNNIGIRKALDEGADFVLLLNNDTVVDPALVGSLVEVIAGSDKIGIVGPKIYYASPPDKIWFAGGEVFLSRGLSKHIGIRETDTGRYDAIRDVDYVTGCALMARREVFETIGYLDPAFVAYYEDTDFCMRARRAGFRVVYVPAGKVWHKISASTGGQLGRAKISRKLRSGLFFFRRYASWYHWLTIPFFFAADVVRVVFLVAAGKIRGASASERTAGQRGT
jgi:GT2 family glycosyltransferase